MTQNEQGWWIDAVDGFTFLVAPDGTRQQSFSLLYELNALQQRLTEAESKVGLTDEVMTQLGRMAGWMRAVMAKASLPARAVELGEDTLDAYEDLLVQLNNGLTLPGG